MGNMIIVGKDCSLCIYCSSIDESNKSRIMVNCTARNKSYTWGQCIPCEDKKIVGKYI